MSVAFSTAATRPAEAETMSSVDGARIVPVAAAFPRVADPSVVVLRNSGGKPLRVRAELLAEGSSRCAGASLWHEVALYRAADGAIAVAIRFLSSGSAESAVHRARLFDDIDSAVSWLEGFDPAFDLGADFDVADTRQSVAQVSLKAAALRDRAERLTRDYRGMIGEVLFRLETEG
jgi:hypothetical protein